ncbi:putative ribonuclease H-like domain-containing protein, partial [Tanacetum coccineum]
DIIFGSTKKELCDEFEKLMKEKFQMISMGELTFFLGLQVQQKNKGIFISQDKYVHEILRKFNYSDVKSASTPTDLEKPLVQDGDAADVDEYLYRSMIGSLMYLIASRLDIMFTVRACARPISWQCKKRTVVATSTTEAEYVAAASCCGQISVLGFKYWNAQSLRPKSLVCFVKFVKCLVVTPHNYMVLNAPCYYNEALASPEQTATAMASPKQTAIGKDSSNPFMAGSLPKTTLCVNL